MSAEIPSLKENIACQLLLKEHDCRHSSWLRKQSFRNKVQLFKWPQVFVVLCGGCVYYYRNETAKVPSGSFSLYGYNSIVRATEVSSSEAPWAFKIVHTHREYKTYLFSASSEVEMKDWMKKIKKELKFANNMNIRSGPVGQEDDNLSQTYQDIESKIYEDPTQFVVPADYKAMRNNDFTDDDDIYRSRGPVAPPVPPREEGRKKGATMHAPKVKDITKKLNETLDLSKQFQMAGHPPVYSRETATTATRRRGSPDGASMKRPAVTESYQAVASPDDDEGEISPEKYWAAIHFVGSEREKSSEIIRTLGEDGVYLVRDGNEKSVKQEKVLVVFVGDMPKKFRIEFESGQWYLNSKPDVRRDTLEELLLYYYDNCLPKYQVALNQPYQLHPKFKSSML